MVNMNLKKAIKKIPPDGEWWSSSGEDDFNDIAGKLKKHGVPDEVILDVLETAYSAVSGEYGN